MAHEIGSPCFVHHRGHDKHGIQGDEKIIFRVILQCQFYSHAYVNIREARTHENPPKAFKMEQRVNSHFDILMVLEYATS